MDRVERVDDQVAVEDREHRATETDEARSAPGGIAVDRLAQELHRPRVVEQDATLDVAHDDALRELRHERSQAVALLLEARIRLAHPPLDVLAQRLARVGQGVQASGEPHHRRRALGRSAMRRIRAQHDPRVLRETFRGLDVPMEQRAGDERDRREQEQRGDGGARGALFEQCHELCAILRRQVGADEDACGDDRREHESPGH